MNKSESIKELAIAFAQAQSKLEPVGKGKKGYGYNYAELASVIDKSIKVLNEHGLSILQPVLESDNCAKVETVLLHTSGEYIASTINVPIPEMKSCNVAQSYGSAITYARRYGLTSLLGIATEDDDAASVPQGKQANKQAPVQPKPDLKAIVMSVADAIDGAKSKEELVSVWEGNKGNLKFIKEQNEEEYNSIYAVFGDKGNSFNN